MINKIKILSVGLTFLLVSCIKYDNYKSNELTKVKTMIVNEYNKNDAKLFTDRENCEFEYFVNNEINDIFCDHIVLGIGMKYFYCPYNQFHFTLLKIQNQYFYYGLSDKKVYSTFLKPRYQLNEKLNDFDYISRIDKLELIDDVNDRNIRLLNYIINLNEYVNKTQSNYRQYKSLRKIFSIIYYVNFFKENNESLICEPIYEDVSEKYRDAILSIMRKPDKNDSLFLYLNRKYDNLSRTYYQDKQSFFLKEENLGIFIYDISKDEGVISISRKFIPENKIYIYPSRFDIPSGINTCN